MLKNIRHLEFIPTNFHEFENILIKHGKLNTDKITIERLYFKCNYETPKIVPNIENVDKKQYSILEIGDAFMVSKINPNLESIDKDSNTNLINTVSRLNYNEFYDYFDFEDLYYLFYNKLKVYFKETIDDIKKALYESSTKNSAKLLIREISILVVESDNFFKKFKTQDIDEITYFGKNNIQIDLYEHLEKYIEQIKLSLNKVFTFYLKEDNLILMNNSKVDSSESKEDKLRNTNIYRIASMFADGTLIIENFTIAYKNKTYLNINSLAEKICQDVPEIPKNSLQPYLNQTVREAKTDKNLFSLSKIKYLELITSDFKTNNKPLSNFFIDKLHILLSNSSE